MTNNSMTCFTAYDIRGEIGINFDAGTAYKVGRATAQHFSAKSIVIGFDARETSKNFAEAACKGILDSGSNVFSIGMCGTEEMYWAVTEFSACAGIEITASHNPMNYNGMKIVKAGSKPLEQEADFKAIQQIAENENWVVQEKKGATNFDRSVEARNKYVEKIISFVEPRNIYSLRVLVNCGNGAAGPTFNQVTQALASKGADIEFINILNDPDPSFPHGIPNPLLEENQVLTSEAIKKNGADLGVAFDGDFDRCFFFDHQGRFIPGEYIVGLLAESFLRKNPGSAIVHDSRVIWNILNVIKENAGTAIQSRTGHAFMKQKLRDNHAIYGGEMSAHHYFRDFAFCDSGLIPCLLILELISTKKKSLKTLLNYRFDKFPSSGEKNFTVTNPKKVILEVLDKMKDGAILDQTDGISLCYEKWRFNIRASNNEPLLRLNVEAKESKKIVDLKTKQIEDIILSSRL